MLSICITCSYFQVDSPVSPGNKGLTLFLQGISDELRQKHRDQLFAVSKKSVIDVAARSVVVILVLHTYMYCI